jgi:hypothetical protein
VAAGAPIGIAFDGFDGYVSAPRQAAMAQVQADARQRHVREILQIDRIDVALPVIHLPSVLETIRNRGGHNSEA